ncbi:hypothetical protein HW49_08950 [Porphyromonadaceae bacterium COT-184 OH4590]|nr:hypothetical protein HW49_08950 [Porphyromonadaceae bacterium COT-184 OH4590]
MWIFEKLKDMTHKQRDCLYYHRDPKVGNVFFYTFTFGSSSDIGAKKMLQAIISYLSTILNPSDAHNFTPRPEPQNFRMSRANFLDINKFISTRQEISLQTSEFFFDKPQKSYFIHNLIH